MNERIQKIYSHTNIKLLLNSELVKVNGYVGNYTVVIRQGNETIKEDIGAIVAAPGYQLISKDRLLFYSNDTDIVDGLQFERILASGSIVRPSDGAVPKDILFVQCAGSRDPEHGMPYCSRLCCMYTAKQVQAYHTLVKDGQAYICYMDIRSDAKGFEEYAQTVMGLEGVLYLRGQVTRVFRDGAKLIVWTVDTLSGKSLEISTDMVVLALAMVPRQETMELARRLNISADAHGFLTEAHIKLRPVESLTAGIFLAGTGQWPRDIPDTIASASAAASKVLSLFSHKELLHEPTTAHVDEAVCAGCGICVNVCTYKAITMNERCKVAVVNEALCEGCGTCAATCPSKAMQHTNWSHRQLFAMIDVAGEGYK
jgi:heterodisulfide reductase subunit A2